MPIEITEPTSIKFDGGTLEISEGAEDACFTVILLTNHTINQLRSCIEACSAAIDVLQKNVAANAAEQDEELTA